MASQQLFTHSSPTIDQEQIKLDVTKLIAKQRILRLIDGGRFFKFSSKGQRLKDRYWCCRLSPNRRKLHYGDLEDINKEPQLDELPNKIDVSDIKNLLIGKDCPHTKDGHMKKPSIDLAFSILYESDHDDYLNFVAVDQKTFCYWTDGINALLKATMTSEEFTKDFDILYDVELRIRTLDK